MIEVVKIADGKPSGMPYMLSVPEGIRAGKLLRIYSAARYVAPSFNPLTEAISELVVNGNTVTSAVVKLRLKDVKRNALYLIESEFSAVLEQGYEYSGTRYKIDFADLTRKYFAAEKGFLDPVEVIISDGTVRAVSASVFLTVAGAVLNRLKMLLAEKENRKSAVRNASTIAEILAVNLSWV